MGCDIHTTAERKTEAGYEPITNIEFTNGSAPFDWRDYGMFGLLAGVRNYSDIKPLSELKGIPKDVSRDVREEYDDWGMDAHSASWLYIDELVEFKYDEQMEDRRITMKMPNGVVSGAETATPGGGELMTYRKFLGEAFFADLSRLEECGADRIVFWFDN